MLEEIKLMLICFDQKEWGQISALPKLKSLPMMEKMIILDMVYHQCKAGVHQWKMQ